MDTPIYEVVVEVGVDTGKVNAACEELVHANSVEVFDPDHAILRVTEQVVAGDAAEAYRLAANVTDAQLQSGGIDPDWFDQYGVRVV